MFIRTRTKALTPSLEYAIIPLRFHAVMKKSMKKLAAMSRDEIAELLQCVADGDIFEARERLITLLNAPDPAGKTEKLETEFREFFCGYESLAFWLEVYEEDPLDGLGSDTALAKKLKRQRDYILVNRKTTLEERKRRRLNSLYLPSDPMPDKKISELSSEEFIELIRTLITEDLFTVRPRVITLLKQHASRQALEEAFREFFVAYELLELALEAYHYDPDEGLELRPEISAEIDRSIADYKSGRVKPVPLETVGK